MDMAIWKVISQHLTHMAKLERKGRFEHPTTRIVRVYLWAVLNDRPVYWACHKRNWRGVKPPKNLPNQSTMSRRLARQSTKEMIDALLDSIEPALKYALVLRIDGKPLPIAKHSSDKRATIGRGAGGFQKGYKLHAIYAGNNRPVVFCVEPMNVDERVVAKRLLERLNLGEGYLLADANYETNTLYDYAAKKGRILVTPRRFANAKGIGQSRKHSTYRLSMIDRMREPTKFLCELYKSRRQIETCYANLTNFGGGLTHIPPWVRGRRVEKYVLAKIIIRLARDQAIKQQRCA